MHRLRCSVLALCWALASCWSVEIYGTQPAERPVNVLLITSEDNGPDLGCYGDPVVRTPNLDRLAAQGARFEHAYVVTASCSESRAALLTGLYPHQNGQIGLATHGYRMFGPVPNIFSRLKARGYRTGLIGKLHVSPESAFPIDYRPNVLNCNTFATRDVVRVAELARRFFASGSGPFFLMVNYADAHLPFLRQQCGLPASPLSAGDVQPLPWIGIDNERLRSVVADYYNCLMRLDAGIGRLLAELERCGRADNTLVIYLSDHGAQFPRGKLTCYESGVRVPLIIRFPGRIRTGTVCRGLVSVIDIVPTILDAVGCPVPAELPGRSLLCLPDGPSNSWRRYLFTEYHGHSPLLYFPQRAVRDERYKLILNLLPERPNPVAAFCSRRAQRPHPPYVTPDELAAAAPPVRAAYDTWWNSPPVELYDLKNDPYEWRNLADDPSLAAVKSRLLEQLRRWRHRTVDPLTDPDKLAKLTAEHDAVERPYHRRANRKWRYVDYLRPSARSQGRPTPKPDQRTDRIKSPKDFFGFPLGADRKLLHWDQILEYFRYLAQESDRLKLINLGKTTLDHDFIMAVISSEQNLGRLQDYKTIQKRLANPINLSDRELDQLLKRGKIVVLVSMNIHSGEIASSQTAVALAYHLLTDASERTKKILDEVILLLVPSMNPDGQAMEVEWYRRNLGTKYEGCNMPWLYHRYAGQQTNRDLFMFNIRESQLIAPVLYGDWLPQIVVDHHQMGVKPGPRIYVPPYSDPINPRLAPEIIAATNMIGTQIAWDMIEEGYAGIRGSAPIQAQHYLGNFSGTPRFHNRVGILVETCSVQRATPVYHEPSELKMPDRARAYDPRPWRAGWWRLGDIIRYQKAATLSILHCAARYRERFLAMFARLNRREAAAGRTQPPYFYIIPAHTGDYITTAEMLKKLSLAAVKICRLRKDVCIQGKQYRQGDYCIPLAQPARRYLLELFARHSYPDKSGRALRDVSTWNMPLLMGVEYSAICEKVSLELEEATDLSVPLETKVSEGAEFMAFPCSFNHSSGLVQQLLEAGCKVYQLQDEWDYDGGKLQQGTFIVPSVEVARSRTGQFLAKWPIPVNGLARLPPRGLLKRLTAPQLAIYHYYTAYDTNQGWIKYVLDRYGIPHAAVYHEDAEDGERLGRYNVIILPSGNIFAKPVRRRPGGKPLMPPMPPRYRKYIDRGRARTLLGFVKRGGVLITLGSASDFVVEYTDLQLANVLQAAKGKVFVPGSLLRSVRVPGHYIGFGYDRPPLIYTLIYPGSAAGRAMYTLYAPVFEVARRSEKIRAALRYAEGDLLVSGYAEGQERIAGGAIVLELTIGAGKIIAFSFDPVYRGWRYGTFRLLLNAIYGSLAKEVEAANGDGDS